MRFDAEQRFNISSTLWLVWVWLLSRCHLCLSLFSFKFKLARICCFHTSQSEPSDCSNPLLPSFLKHQCRLSNILFLGGKMRRQRWTPNEPHSQQLLWLQTTTTQIESINSNFPLQSRSARNHGCDHGSQGAEKSYLLLSGHKKKRDDETVRGWEASVNAAAWTEEPTNMAIPFKTGSAASSTFISNYILH